MKRLLAAALMAALLISWAAALTPEPDLRVEFPADGDAATAELLDEPLLPDGCEALYDLLVEKLGDWEHIWDSVELVDGTPMFVVDVSSLNFPYVTNDTAEQVRRCLKLMTYEHPEIFYVRALRKVSAFQNKDGAFLATLHFSAYDGYTRAMCAQLDARMTAILVPYEDAGLTDLEKALAIHDYLVEHIAYNSDVMNGLGLADGVPRYVWDIYGALVKGDAVCQGYANAYVALLTRLGVPCRFVPAAGANHSWNVVRLGGVWYHVDVTFDDPAPDAPGYCGHGYFLRSDAGIADDLHDPADWRAVDWRTGDAITCSDDRYEGDGWAFSGSEHALRRLESGDYWYIDGDGALVCGGLAKTGGETAAALSVARACGVLWEGTRLYYPSGARDQLAPGEVERYTLACYDAATGERRSFGEFDYPREWFSDGDGCQAGVLYPVLTTQAGVTRAEVVSNFSQSPFYTFRLFSKSWSGEKTALVEVYSGENGHRVGVNWTGEPGGDAILCAAWYKGKNLQDLRYERVTLTSGAQWVGFTQPRSTQAGEKVRFFLLSAGEDLTPLSPALRP